MPKKPIHINKKYHKKALEMLYNEDKKLKTAVIAQKLNLSVGSTIKLLNALVHKKLINVNKYKYDNRTIEYSINKKGILAFKVWRQYYEEH